MPHTAQASEVILLVEAAEAPAGLEVAGVREEMEASAEEVTGDTEKGQAAA